jgi:hypothetical protein
MLAFGPIFHACRGMSMPGGLNSVLENLKVINNSISNENAMVSGCQSLLQKKKIVKILLLDALPICSNYLGNVLATGIRMISPLRALAAQPKSLFGFGDEAGRRGKKGGWRGEGRKRAGDVGSM